MTAINNSTTPQHNKLRVCLGVILVKMCVFVSNIIIRSVFKENHLVFRYNKKSVLQVNLLTFKSNFQKFA